MTRIVSRLKLWLNKRFVLMIEIVGYVLSAAVGVAAVYSLFAQVEVLAHATAEIHPAFATISTDKDAVVFDFLVSSGDEVSAGEPVCRVVTDPEARRRLLTRRQLEEAVSSLEQDARGGRALAEARAALRSLPPLGEPETLRAPVAGSVKCLVQAATSETLPAGKPLATIYQLDTLMLEATVERNGAAKVASGQTARVNLPGILEPVVGNVASTAATPGGISVVIKFDNVALSVRQIFTQKLFGPGDTPPLPPVRVEIVVGHQSLFVNMFGRKA